MSDLPTAEQSITHRRSRLAVEALLVALAICFVAFAIIAGPHWVEIHRNPVRCITDPHQLSLGNFFRWLAGFLALVLLALTRPLGRFAGRIGISRGGWLRVSLAVFLALGASEVILRKPWNAAAPSLPCPICPDGTPSARYSWQLTPSQTHVWQGPHDTITYFTDADGNRSASVGTTPNHDLPTLILGGESITLGIGVNYEDTFAGILAKDLQVQVVNTAVFGYAMDQAFMREEDIFRQYSHPIALITTTIPEQVERFDVDYRHRLEVDASGGLETVPPLTPWIRDLQLRHVWRELYHSSAEIEDMRAIARATVALAKERNAFALFLTTNFGSPCLDVKGESPALFRTVLDDQGIPRVHVDLPPNQWVEGDLHPGPVSHRALAHAIEQKLHEAHVL
jgi:hypothetical protein